MTSENSSHVAMSGAPLTTFADLHVARVHDQVGRIEVRREEGRELVLRVDHGRELLLVSGRPHIEIGRRGRGAGVRSVGEIEEELAAAGVERRVLRVQDVARLRVAGRAPDGRHVDEQRLRLRVPAAVDRAGRVDAVVVSRTRRLVRRVVGVRMVEVGERDALHRRGVGDRVDEADEMVVRDDRADVDPIGSVGVRHSALRGLTLAFLEARDSHAVRTAAANRAQNKESSRSEK